MKRKILNIVCVGMLLGVLTGCSSAEGAVAAQSGEQNFSQENVVSRVQEDAKQEVIKSAESTEAVKESLKQAFLEEANKHSYRT